MNKQDFLALLRARLVGFPPSEIEERLEFYAEMIEDRMEDGCAEEEAVAAIGDIDAVIEQITAEMPLSKLVTERIKPKKKMRAWEIILLIIGSPIWLSLLIALFAIIFSLYIALWAVIVSLWAVFAALAGCGLGGIGAGILMACNGQLPIGLAIIGAALACAGLSILLFYGCRAASIGLLRLSRKIALGIKKTIIRKGGAE